MAIEQGELVQETRKERERREKRGSQSHTGGRSSGLLVALLKLKDLDCVVDHGV